MLIPKENLYVSDTPVENENEDVLERKVFVSALADSLINYQSKDSLVIGLYGSWGAGKTSILNMTKNHIKRETESLAPEIKPIVFYFKPWNFSSADQLLQNFFEDLIYSMRSARRDIKFNWEDDIRIYAKKVSPFINGVASIVSIIPGLSTAITESTKIAKQAVNHLQNSPSLAELRKKLLEKLERFDQKIIIFIDDIDRLDADQIMMVFRLVKQIADFPNILYVLAMDKDIVSKIVEKSQYVDGEKYLEKLVQVPLNIPQINRDVLSKYIDDAFLHIYKNGWARDVRYRSMLYDGITPALQTLRECKRLIDDFRFRSYSLGIKERGELGFSPVDLLGVCAIYLWAPELVKVIYQCKVALCGADKEPTDFEQNQLDLLHENLGKVKNHTWINYILALLFPRWEKYTDTYIPAQIQNDNESIAFESRIADVNLFDFYFRLSVEAYPASREKARDFVTQGVKGMNKMLLECKNSNNPSAFFAYLKTFAKQNITSKQSTIVVLYQIRSLLKISNINQVNAVTNIAFSAELCGSEILWNSGMNRQERYQTLKQVIEEGDIYALSGQVCYDLLRLMEGLDRENISEENNDIYSLFTTYERQLIKEVKAGKLFQLQCFDHILILWAGINKDSYVDIMRKQIKDLYHKLLFLCASIIPQTVGRYAPRYPYNYKQYQDILSFAEAKRAIEYFEQNIKQYYPGCGEYSLNEYQLKELAFVKLQLQNGSGLTITPEEVQVVLDDWNGRIM